MCIRPWWYVANCYLFWQIKYVCTDNHTHDIKRKESFNKVKTWLRGGNTITWRHAENGDCRKILMNILARYQRMLYNRHMVYLFRKLFLFYCRLPLGDSLCMFEYRERCQFDFILPVPCSATKISFAYFDVNFLTERSELVENNNYVSDSLYHVSRKHKDPVINDFTVPFSEVSCCRLGRHFFIQSKNQFA